VTGGGAGEAGPSAVVLVDFDGTIARSDISDEVMRRFADPGEWAPLEAAYLRGDIGSRTLLTLQAELLHGGGEQIATIADGQQFDPHFVPFVAFLRESGIAIEVVSDGFGFFVKPALAQIGLDDLPVFTAETTFGDGRVIIDFPMGNPQCRVCGTCKRARILVHQAAGRLVAFVGDGFSDLYAAAYADLVFAKDHLAELCADRGWPFHGWATFADIMDQLPALLADRPAVRRARPFICGPEVWPPGTLEPLWDRRPAPRTTPSGT
jgi:2-hydroxy-3-keto-5-methylthiopentenyl-1-phosphate phosphatase